MVKEARLDFRGVKPKRKRKEIVSGEERNEKGKLMWPAFWDAPYVPEDWLIEPLLPRGRSIAMYCVAGIGKSELALFVSVKAALGEHFLDKSKSDPLEVAYLDYEMTSNDVKERLMAQGYDRDTDLSHLHYYLLPTLPPLDTRPGGDALLQLCRDDNIDLVVIDTTSRVITGDEGLSDTLRDFHEHSGRRLKELGITIWRLDHAGKNLAAGQRGTSAKNDDVDIIWSLQRTRSGVRLHAEKRRQDWVPEDLNLTRRQNPLWYGFSDDLLKERYAQRLRSLISKMRELQIPRDSTVRGARAVLRNANVPAKQDLLVDALRRRKRNAKTELGNKKVTQNGNRP